MIVSACRLLHMRSYLHRIIRAGRSLLTLNRDREYASLREILALRRTDKLLDVGCGDGFWTTRFAKHSGPCVGLDPSECTLGNAHRLHHGPNVSYICANSECLPFPDATFDRVVSVSCLEHFGNPAQGLREMVRVLKYDGILALSVDSLLPANSSSSFRGWHSQRHFVTRYFDQHNLLESLEELELNCESHEVVHLFRSKVAASLRQTFIRHPRFWLPLFPLFYGAVRVGDRTFNDMHGQIIIVGAKR